jgi:biopolymer transport protein ExbD/biopolymer transport protein TolR
MGMNVGSTSSRLPSPEINVTPLVDVVLVLLIIFMVIAPAIVEGERVELPVILNPDKDARDMTPIEVILTTHGALLVGREHIEPSQLKPKLEAMHRADSNRQLIMKTDENIPYKKVRETFAVIQDIGFKGVSLKVIQKGPAGA